MKKSLLLIAFSLFTLLTFGQSIPKEYYDLVKIADSLYNAHDYKNSANYYTAAFKANGWKGMPNY